MLQAPPASRTSAVLLSTPSITATATPLPCTPATTPVPPYPSAPCSRLALLTKLTLDQALGFALWHAALAAIHEPHRQACMALVQRPQREQQQQQQQARAANTTK